MTNTPELKSVIEERSISLEPMRFQLKASNNTGIACAEFKVLLLKLGLVEARRHQAGILPPKNQKKQEDGTI